MSFYKTAHFFKQNIHGDSLVNARAKINLCVILMATFAFCPVVAQEQNTLDVTKQLLASCKAFKANPKHIDAMPCIYYTKGFLAGAWNLDQANKTQIKENNRAPANWEERAYRHRVGNRGDLKTANSTTRLHSPGHVPEARVIEMLSKVSSSKAPSIEALNVQILGALEVLNPAAQAIEK